MEPILDDAMSSLITPYDMVCIILFMLEIIFSIDC